VSVQRRLHDELGISTDIAEERRRFVNRIEESVINRLDAVDEGTLEPIVRRVCYELGKSYDQIHLRHFGPNPRFVGQSNVPPLRRTYGDSFEDFLTVLATLYEIGSNAKVATIRKWLDTDIPSALDRAGTKLDLRWHKGMFYRSGEDVLDREVVEKGLNCLDPWPEASRTFTDALKAHSEGNPDVVLTKCYLCIESLAKAITGADGSLDKLRERFGSILGLSREENRLLDTLVLCLHPGRHTGAAGTVRQIGDEQAEFVLYVTGAVARLAARRHQTGRN